MKLLNLKNLVCNDTTTLGKSGKVLFWAGLSVILVAVLTAVTNNPNLFDPKFVLIANVLLVALKNLFDSQIKNI